MHMFSSDIVIKVKTIVVAHHLIEALQFVEHPKGLELTVPHDEFFSDRLFDDPLLRDLSFSTSFTFYGIDRDEPLFDAGPVNDGEKANGKQFGPEFDTQRSFWGTAHVAATVYIKSDNLTSANKVFRDLDGTQFEFAKQNSVAALGLEEVNDFAFVPQFICVVTPEMSLKERGFCPSYSAIAADRKIFVHKDGRHIVKY